MLNPDVKTDSSTRSEGLANMGVIAGIAAALVLLLALICVALYINYHPTASSPLYLIQVSTKYTLHLQLETSYCWNTVLYVHTEHSFSVLEFFSATQEPLAFL